MVLLKLSAVSPAHYETDPKIKRSAYAAQRLLARYRDELAGLFSAEQLAPRQGEVGVMASDEASG